MRFNFWQKLVAKAVLWALFGPELPSERIVDRAILQTIKMLRNFKHDEQKEIIRAALNYTYPNAHIHANPKARRIEIIN